MSFKTRFTWPGICLVILLLVLNLSTVGLAIAAMVNDFPQWSEAERAGLSVPSRSTYVKEIFTLVVLVNLTALPFLLLTLRLNRTVH